MQWWPLSRIMYPHASLSSGTVSSRSLCLGPVDWVFLKLSLFILFSVLFFFSHKGRISGLRNESSKNCETRLTRHLSLPSQVESGHPSWGASSDVANDLLLVSNVKLVVEGFHRLFAAWKLPVKSICTCLTQEAKHVDLFCACRPMPTYKHRELWTLMVS